MDRPTSPPSSSAHWSGLTHRPGDRLIGTASDLASLLRSDLASLGPGGGGRRRGRDPSGVGPIEGGGGGASEPIGAYDTDAAGGGAALARWSCVCGYVEAVTTNRDAGRRFSPFPVPVDALARLVDGDFAAFVRGLGMDGGGLEHREAVRSMSNAVWSRVLSKPSVRDEIHSNSVYIFLRGGVDRRTLDCFGSAVTTVAGLGLSGRRSFLTLSEDHAYESHPRSCDGGDGGAREGAGGGGHGTCEIAVPGNTKAARRRRGREIADTFSSDPHRTSRLTPRTSWLYMAAHPVVCAGAATAIAAAVANINCHIESRGGRSVSSGPLYEIKRELLWALYDGGCIDDFPFALAELGECEENAGSERGYEWVRAEGLGGVDVLRNEKLFMDAIAVSREKYGDSQVYPYCYAGHYHKDAGRESAEQEYRLAEALRLYSNAARIASRYPFEPGDSMQLVKTMTKLAELISSDILAAPYDDCDSKGNSKNGGRREPRRWRRRSDAVSAATWLLAFYDHLLLWEERSGGDNEGGGTPPSCSGRRFVEILSPDHKHSVGKMFELFEREVRQDMVSIIYDDGTAVGASSPDPLLDAITYDRLRYYQLPKSKRMMSRDGPLVAALLKAKISVGELELTIPGSEDGGRRRRNKRARMNL